jgi:hypothetical protein
MEAIFDLRLTDVLEEKEAIPVSIVVSQGRSDDGVVVKDAQGLTRIVIENHKGILIVHTWKTIEAAEFAQDPITIELETK